MVENNDMQTPPVVAPAVALRPPRRRTWLTILLAAMILISGIAIGLGGAMAWLRDRTPLPESSADVAATEIATDIAAKYDLDEKQTLRVKEIMAARLTALRAIRQEMFEKVAAEHEKLRSEMKDALSGEQFRRWDARFEALQKRRRFYRPGRAGRPLGRPGGGEGLGRFDKNRDGVLTGDEIAEIPQPLRSRFMQADTDGDGVITAEEFRRRMRQGRRPGAGGPDPATRRRP